MTPEAIGRKAISMRRENVSKAGILGPMIDQAIREEDRLIRLADTKRLARELLTLSEMAFKATDARSVGWLDARIAEIVVSLGEMFPPRDTDGTGTTTGTGAASL